MGYLMKVTVGFVAFAVVVLAALWGFGVLTAPWKGQGDAFKQKEAADNWVAAQAGFHQKYEQIHAFDQQIADADTKVKEFEAQHPNLGNGTPYDPMAEQDKNLRDTLTGLTQQCQNTVSAYNTDAQSYLTQDFRDANLPDRIDQSSECKAATTTSTTTPRTTP